ncbi:MAG: IclR family transcriptional regulator [Pseudomonadota bacterium]
MISRASEILRLLGRETDGLSLGQIAKRVDLPRSTVQRIVSTLSVEGFVSTAKGYGEIRLGPEIQLLARAAAADIKDRLRPVMKHISTETGETVDLAVLERSRMRFVDQIVGSQRLRTVSSIGETFPLTTTANGKAALACLDLAEATRLILDEVQGHADGSRRLSDLLAQIERIREGGLAQDTDEHTDGVSALGFAIKDGNGDVYAISVPVPSSRFGRIFETLSATIEDCRARSLP